MGLSCLRRRPGEDIDGIGTTQRVLLDRIRGHRPLNQFERGGFVTEAHIRQREITNQLKVFWLFFEERFQFAARLPRSEEHTSELQSQSNLVCRLLLEKTKTNVQTDERTCNPSRLTVAGLPDSSTQPSP